MKIKMSALLLISAVIINNQSKAAALENAGNNQSRMNEMKASSFQPGYEKKFMADISQADAQEIGKQLNILDASLRALCVKTHGFTANIVSPDFYEYHSFFNLTVTYLQSASYEIAERVRSLGVMANTTVADIQQKSKIKDAQAVLTAPADMVAELWQDYMIVSSQARGIFRMAASVGDAGTIALATKTTNQLEHFQWELRVMTGKK